VAFGVPRCRDNFEVCHGRKRTLAFQDVLAPLCVGVDIIGVNKPLTLKVTVKLLMIGDIVLVREDHVFHAPSFFELPYQKGMKFRRIDQDIPFRPFD
jgi:hypothetical protein